jgi:hypothetical protein
MIRRGRIAFALGFSVLLAGCGRNPDQICEDFVKECGGGNLVDDCKTRAAQLEAEAEQKHCLQLWDEYVGCVGDQQSLCDSADSCVSQRQNLVQFCGIVFQ